VGSPDHCESFGGYLVNWIVTHDTRYKAAVSHAGIWSLDTYCAVADVGHEPEHQFGPLSRTNREVYQAVSPAWPDRPIDTPMLVVQGARDYRVPEGESLQLWRHLCRQGGDHRFLYLPDEGHWISTPTAIRTWYRTVIAFLDHHLRDGPPPEEWLAALGIGSTALAARGRDLCC
jgi:dipeptidyl aminopeptidase/acylaminoacyl peptidase